MMQHSAGESSELQQLLAEISLRQDELLQRREQARRDLRRINRAETFGVFAFLIGFGFAVSLLSIAFSIPFKPDWQWLGTAFAFASAMLGTWACYAWHPAAKTMNRWLATAKQKKEDCEKILLMDTGYDIQLLKQRAEMLQSHLIASDLVED